MLQAGVLDNSTIPPAEEISLAQTVGPTIDSVFGAITCIFLSRKSSICWREAVKNSISLQRESTVAVLVGERGEPGDAEKATVIESTVVFGSHLSLLARSLVSPMIMRTTFAKSTGFGTILSNSANLS